MIEHRLGDATILVGDVRDGLATLPAASVHCVVTSPPYWGLRDYGVSGQLGLESSPDEYVSSLVEVFRDVRRVLRDDGTCWLNLGDSYAQNGTAGLRSKDLCGIPWRVAFALQADGWLLRQDIIWQKPSPMPESMKDRCTKAHEYIFLLAKQPRYFFDWVALRERGLADKRIVRRSVWRISPAPYPEAHFATFPPELPRLCITAGTSELGVCSACGAQAVRRIERRRLYCERKNNYVKRTGAKGTGNCISGCVDGVDIQTVGWDTPCSCGAPLTKATVLDPFLGSGTTAAVALSLGRAAIGCELNPEYATMAENRIRAAASESPLFLGDTLAAE